MSREMKFDYIFKNDHGEFFHYKTHLHNITKGMGTICDMWDVFPIVAVRQYTGLKDKNGVEIYEGDIVKGRDGEIYVCEFESKPWGAGLKFRNLDKDWDFGGGYKLEVIGNIHETPELLE